MNGLGALVSFADPAVGENSTTAVPAGERWRLWGGSCLLTTSAATPNRNPFLVYQSGNTISQAQGQDGAWQSASPTNYVGPSAAVTLVFYDYQTELQELFDMSLGTFLPIGCNPIWLPAGTSITCFVQNLDAADQISNVGLLVESEAA